MVHGILRYRGPDETTLHCISDYSLKFVYTLGVKRLDERGVDTSVSRTLYEETEDGSWVLRPRQNLDCH